MPEKRKRLWLCGIGVELLLDGSVGWVCASSWTELMLRGLGVWISLGRWLDLRERVEGSDCLVLASCFLELEFYCLELASCFLGWVSCCPESVYGFLCEHLHLQLSPEPLPGSVYSRRDCWRPRLILGPSLA